MTVTAILILKVGNSLSVLPLNLSSQTNPFDSEMTKIIRLFNERLFQSELEISQDF